MGTNCQWITRLSARRAFTVYPHGVKLPVYAYQVVGQNVDNVTGNLLNTRQSSNLNQRREGQQITYSNNGRLTYDESTGIIDYVNYWQG